jgi:hypothetical protein
LLKKIILRKLLDMKKIKRISLALAIIPLLQTGCSQETISRVAPAKSANKNVMIELEDTKDEIILSKTIEDNSSYTIDADETTDYIVLSEDEPEMIDGGLLETIGYEEGSDIEDAPLMTIAELNNNLLNGDIEMIDSGWGILSKEDEIVETAKNFLGTKYVWAGNGPRSFDCSGFTKYVYKENGITIPRHSGHQAKVGMKVSFNELQKGDLVFFNTESKFRGKVNHVGIYIGNNKFIHASSAKKKVVITSFTERPFYKRRFLRGERIVNSSSAYASSL